LELFTAELLIGIIRSGIFTNARVGIIRGETFNWNYLCWNIYQRQSWNYSWCNFFLIGIIYDGIFTDSRVGNI